MAKLRALIRTDELIATDVEGLFRRPLGFGDFSKISIHLKSETATTSSLADDVEVMRAVALVLFERGVICDARGELFEDVQSLDDLDVVPANVLVSTVAAVIDEITQTGQSKKKK